MTIDNYIQIGDEIAVMYRSLTLDGFRGTVLDITEGRPGTREIIIVREGTSLLDVGAVGVRENLAVFSVRRGDSWVGVLLPLTIEEATAKSVRNVANQAKRILQKVPLFAEQIQPTPIDPETWVAMSRESGQETLDRNHKLAVEATSFRDQVQTLVTSEEFEILCERRTGYPKDGLYGCIFWKKQIEHIQLHGCPDIFKAPPPLTKGIDLPWLKNDAQLTWKTAPGGPQPVRVLFVGSETVMVRLVGEPIKDYDPKLIPNRNNWIAPEAFAESAQAA